MSALEKFRESNYPAATAIPLTGWVTSERASEGAADRPTESRQLGMKPAEQTVIFIVTLAS